MLELFGRGYIRLVSYREYEPADELTHLVACTWEREGPIGSPATTRVVPDGCVDLVWRSGELLIAGPDRGPFRSPVPADETVVGVRLLPGAAGPVLGLPASELLDLRVPLADVWELEGLVDRLAAASSPKERRAALERALVVRRAQIGALDPLVLAATRRLGLPQARVRALSDELGASERQLRRRFHDAVGYGPKVLDRVLRFQRLLARLPAVGAGEDELARVAAELGYADQAHLTRECRALAGVPPTELATPFTAHPRG